MTTWTDGYVIDIPYTSGFYREMTPMHIAWASLGVGQRCDWMRPGAAVCELACGQGFGTALMAAANPGLDFWGFDFNPGQIANARRLAAEAGLDNVRFDDLSFRQLADAPPAELPMFDVILLHGIYSWISQENRAAIVSFIGQRLKPGGTVYVSYNCMPGWAAIAPLQRLIREHADRHPNRSDQAAAEAIDYAAKIQEGGALYFARNPQLKDRLESIKKQNKNYIAHEYLNGYWHPLYFTDVVGELSEAKLTFVASATLMENLDAVALPPAFRQHVADAPDPIFAQLLRDYASNKQFRRDIYARGVTRYTGAEMGRHMRQLGFYLTVARSAATTTIKTPIGEGKGDAILYPAIFDALAEQPGIAVDQILHKTGAQMPQVAQALSILTGTGQIGPSAAWLRDADAQQSYAAAQRFNAAVARRATAGDVMNFLAAPATGSGLAASTVDLMAYAVLLDAPNSTVDDLATGVVAALAALGQKVLKDGKPIEDKAATRAHVTTLMTDFQAKTLPLWRSLGVI